MTKVSAKHKLEMPGKDGFFRGKVLDLLFEKKNDEALDYCYRKSFSFLHKTYET